MSARSAPPAVAYSYVRFSSPEQARGDSLRRQTELRDAWLKRSGAVLDKSLTLRDEGVSAFTGSHRENGDRNALAAFLELVKKNRIPRGSFLIVESLDRLTREHIRPALTLLLNLIDHGVRVVQLLPAEAVYDEHVEPMTLMQAIMELSRGHSESRMKSERLGAAWRAKKQAAAKGGRPITRAVPGWVTVQGEKFVLDKPAAAAVRRIYKLATEGHGLGVITKLLNAEGVKPIGRADYWARSYIAKILASRATMGEFQPHRGHAGPNRKPDGKPIAGYFPAAVSEDEWHAARAALGKRRQKGAGRIGKSVALFSGLVKDARDGGPLVQVSKGGKSSKQQLVSYRAAQGLRGAKYVSFPLVPFEAAVLSRLREIDPREVLPSKDGAANRVAALAGKQMELEGRITKLKAALVSGGEIDSVIDALRTLDADLKATTAELGAARQEAASPLSGAWKDVHSLVDVLAKAPDPTDARTRLRAALRRAVDSIHCLFIASGPIRIAAVQVAFAGGHHRRYLITAKPAKGNAAARRPAEWAAADFASAKLPALDLGKPKDAAKLEREILRAMN